MSNSKKFRWRMLSLVLALACTSSFVLAGCGSSSSTTTTTESTTTESSSAATTESSSSSEAASTATATTDKTEIVIGCIVPLTGGSATCGQSIEWVTELYLDKINNELGGIYLSEYDVSLPVRVVWGDTTSDSTVASDLANKMVLEDEVDLLWAAWTPDTTVPVSAVAERYEVPCIGINSPIEVWNGGDNDMYDWAYGLFFYANDMYPSYVTAWDAADTNKVVGFAFDSDADGLTGAEILTEILPERGYTFVDPGRFPADTSDFTSIISQFKAEGVEILVGNMLTPAFTTLWKQCVEQGFTPEIVTVGKAIHYAQDCSTIADSVGDVATSYGFMSENFWSKDFGYTDSLTGMTTQEFAALYEEENGYQHPENIGYEASFWTLAYDVLTEAGSLEPQAIKDAIETVESDTMFGTLNCDAETNCFIHNVSVMQWLPGTDWDYESTLIVNDNGEIVNDAISKSALS